MNGAFPIVDEKIYFPRPLDALIHKTDKAAGTADILRVRPMSGNAGVRMPHASLVPSEPVGMPEEDFKPESGDAFWPLATMAEWLGCEDDQPVSMKINGLPAPVKEDRTNVTILPESGAAEDARLFTTTGLDFVRKPQKDTPEGRLSQMRIGVRVNFGEHAPLPERLLVPLGGERRLAEVWTAEADKGFWEVPKGLSWAGKKGLRMVLATPAVFERGWLPGWLREQDGKLTGAIPGRVGPARLRRRGALEAPVRVELRRRQERSQAPASDGPRGERVFLRGVGGRGGYCRSLAPFRLRLPAGRARWLWAGPLGFLAWP